MMRPEIDPEPEGWVHTCETKRGPVWLPWQSICPFCWRGFR